MLWLMYVYGLFIVYVLLFSFMAGLPGLGELAAGGLEVLAVVYIYIYIYISICMYIYIYIYMYA